MVRLWRGLPMRVTHTTEPAHHRAAGLCAARWCAARLCEIRLGCVMVTRAIACDDIIIWLYRLIGRNGGIMSITHDDVIKWKHFRRCWPFVWGVHRSPVNSPHKGKWHGALMFSLICSWINGWVSDREAVDLRRHRVHYDTTATKTKWWVTVLGGLLYWLSYSDITVWICNCIYLFYMKDNYESMSSFSRWPNWHYQAKAAPQIKPGSRFIDRKCFCQAVLIGKERFVAKRRNWIAWTRNTLPWSLDGAIMSGLRVTKTCACLGYFRRLSE